MSVFGRAAAILVAALTGARLALFPRIATTDQRLAVFPTTGLPLQRPVSIRWNSFQIPHIAAETDHDLGVALGLVHGHLRLGQVALIKRLTEGRASELAGPFFAPKLDQALRAIDFRRAGPAIVAAMPAATRAYLEAFLKGLNFQQRTVKRLPPEFALFGMKREDFTLEDVIAIGHVAGLDINWFTLIGLMRERDAPDYETILRDTLEAGAGPTVSFDSGLAGTILANAVRSGSNSFAIAPSRSASGSALIANDPHLGVALPNLWVLAGLKSPSWNGVGMMIPGTPFLAFGRTPDIAWGGTNMRAAHSDFYDVTELPPERIVSTTHRIKRRFWFSGTVTTRTAIGVGPIMSDTLAMNGATRAGETVAVRWIGHELTDEISAILKAAQATTPQDFRSALATFALPAQNFVYADARGNIAQVTATMLPRRPFDILPASIVLDGADPAMAWQGIANPTELPWALNPPDGMAASANNKPYEPQPNVPVGFFFSADERIRRIRQMIGEKNQITIDDLQAMQQDTVSLFVREMMPAIRRAIDETAGAREMAPAFVDRLVAFDGDYRVDAAGAPAFECFLYRFAPRVYGVETPDQLRVSLAPWNGLGKRFARDLAALAPERRRAIVAESIRLAAPDAEPFPVWGEMHRLQVAHVLGAIPVLGEHFVYGDLPSGGSRETVFKAAHGFERTQHRVRYGSQARQISDLGDPDANWFVMLGGNDGWIGSVNLTDQIPLWQSGDYIRMPLRPETIAVEFPHVMTLTP